LFTASSGRPSIRPKARELGEEIEHTEEWVLAFRSVGTLPPLFCVCGGGGDIFDYRDLALALPEEQPVYVFGVPPLEPGEVFPTVQRLAAIYVGEVRKRQPRGPYRLCGHSFGGVVVYEMAALLADQGEEIGLVAMLDTLHPAFKRTMSGGQRLQFQLFYISDRVRKYTRNLASGRIDRIARDAFDCCRVWCKRTAFKVIRSIFGRLGQAIPGPIRSDELILVSAWHRYDPGNYTGPLVLINAADRPPEFGTDHMLGWDRSATGTIRVHVVPGDHLSFMHPPHVQALVEQIVPYLAGP
jgi:thioesterase domain-containing protein